MYRLFPKIFKWSTDWSTSWISSPWHSRGDLCFLLKLTSLMNQVSETLALLGEIPNDIEGLILCIKDIGVNFIMWVVI